MKLMLNAHLEVHVSKVKSKFLVEKKKTKNTFSFKHCKKVAYQQVFGSAQILQHHCLQEVRGSREHLQD